MIIRDKKVTRAIKSMRGFIEKKYYNGVTAEEMKIVLDYIEELEQDNRNQRFQLNSAYDNGFIHKDLIKEEIERWLDIGEGSAANLLSLFLEGLDEKI